MNCSKVTGMLDALREGHLKEEETADVRGHLAGCGRCRETLSKFEEFDAELSSTLKESALPVGFAVRTVAASGRAGMAPAGVRPGVWGALAAAACVVIGAAVHFAVSEDPQIATNPATNRLAVIAMASNVSSTVGPAFIAGRHGESKPYRGRTSVKVIWNFSQNAPELVVDAFPGEE